MIIKIVKYGFLSILAVTIVVFITAIAMESIYQLGWAISLSLLFGGILAIVFYGICWGIVAIGIHLFIEDIKKLFTIS